MAAIQSHSNGLETLEAEVQTLEAVQKTWMQKASGPAAMHDIDDEETTDVGQSSASETESSSGLSSNEGSRSLGKRCRFGRTPLETIPATPSAGAAHLGSPPGFSRAAMRQARDVCRPGASLATTDANGLSESARAESSHDGGVPISKNLCRFGESALETVPKTPVNGAKWKALATKLGSPPGLSRAEMRQERDACKAAAPTTWGSCQSSSAVRLTKRTPAREAVLRMKNEASLLKDLKVERTLNTVEASKHSPFSSSESEEDHSTLDEDLSEKQECPSLGHAAGETVEAVHSSCSEAESSTDVSSAERQRCRFGTTPLGTIPSTPVNGQMSVASPPGLSRKAMRQARDACTAGATTAARWGTCTAPVLTINPSGKPMTPPAVRAARRRAERDSVCAGQEGYPLITPPVAASIAPR